MTQSAKNDIFYSHTVYPIKNMHKLRYLYIFIKDPIKIRTFLKMKFNFSKIPHFKLKYILN